MFTLVYIYRAQAYCRVGSSVSRAPNSPGKSLHFGTAARLGRTVPLHICMASGNTIFIRVYDFGTWQSGVYVLKVTFAIFAQKVLCRG